MKRFFTFLILFFLIITGYKSSAQVDLVGWNFPNNPDDNIADIGIAANLLKTITTNSTGVVAYNVAGSTTFSAINTNWDGGMNTKYWLAEFATTGYKEIKISSKQRSSTTGPKDFKLQYMLGSSGTWIDVIGVTNIVTADNFILGEISSIALPSECDNQASVSLRWIMTSNTSVNAATVLAAGESQIDDVLATGLLLSSEAEILTFNIPGQTLSTINSGLSTIYVVFPTGTNVTALVPTLTVSSGATALPASLASQDFTIPVTYNITAEDGSNKTWTVIVSFAGPLSISADQTICNNSVATLSVTSNLSDYNTYIWTPITNLYTDAGATIPYVAGTNAVTVYLKSVTAGELTYTCTSSNTTSLVSDNATTIITVLPVSSTVTVTPTSVCFSGAAVLNVNPAIDYGVATFQWQNSPDNITFTDIPGANAISFNTPVLNATTYYKLQVYSGTSLCTESSAVMTINNPSVTVTDGSRCGLGTVTLGATSSLGTILKWYNFATGGLAIATGSTFTTPVISTNTSYWVEPILYNASYNVGLVSESGVSGVYGGGAMYFSTTASVIIKSIDVYPGATGTLTITLIDDLGSTVDFKTFSIGNPDVSSTVKKTLNLGFNIPSAVTGWKLYYDINLYRGGGSYTYPYVGNDLSITGNSFNGNNITSGNRMYFYNWQVTPSCIGNRTEVVATIDAPPAVSILSNTSDICQGSTVELEASSLNNNYTYNWSVGTLPSLGQFVEVAPLSTSTYSVTATDNSGTGCVNTASTTINVRLLPTNVTVIASSTDVICGTSCNLNVSNNNALTFLINENFNETTNNWVTTNNSTGGDSANTAWTLRPNGYSYSSATFISNDNSQFYLSNSDVQGSSGITETILESPSFSTLNLGTLNLSFYQFYNHYTGSTGIVEVWNGTAWNVVATYSAVDGSISNFAAKSINLNDYINLVDVKVRFRYSANWGNYWAIDNVLVGGNYQNTYEWSSTPGVFTSTLQNPTSQILTVPTTFNVTVTNAVGCSSTASQSFNIVPFSPVAETISGSSAVCQGQIDEVYSVPIITGATSYIWTLPSGATGTSATNNITVDFATNAVTGIITVKGNNSCGDGATSSSTITVNPLPFINLGIDTTICRQAIIQGPSGLASYLWSDGSSDSSLTVTSTGTYSLTVTTGFSCSKSDSILITILPAPEFDLGQDITISGLQTIIIGTSTNFESYLWSTSSTQNYIVVTSASLGEGTFTYWVTIHNSIGCSTVDSINVTVIGDVGVNENNQNTLINIYPNPANDKVWIESLNSNNNSIKIEILSMDGRVLFENESTKFGFAKIFVDLNNYASGIYMIKAVSEDKTIIQKLVVQ